MRFCWLGAVVALALWTAGHGVASNSWTSVKEVQRAFVAHWLWGNYCLPDAGGCGPAVGGGVAVRLQVTSAHARGIGPSRVVNGVRKWHTFTVYVCGRNYREGAETYGGDMVR